MGGEAEVKVASPAFSLAEAAGKLANLEDEVVEDLEVGVDTLGSVEPVLLGGVGGEGFALGREDRGGIHEGFDGGSDAGQIFRECATYT